MGTLYCAPEDLWIHAAPPSLLFGDADSGIEGIDQGTISTPTRLSGTGAGRVTAGGIPRAAWQVRVRCVVGGEVNDASTLNPSTTALPSFQFSNNAGVSYGPAVTVSAHRDKAIIEYAKFGIKFYFENGSAPSFVAGDVWGCDTTPSADIIAGIPVVCAFMDKYLAGSFDLPLTEYPPDFTAHACDLLRWRLLRKLGIAERQDVQVYRPVEVMKWLEAAQKGDFVKPKTSLGITETAPGTSVQRILPIPQRSLLCKEFPI